MVAYAQTFGKVVNGPVVGPLINKIFDFVVIPVIEIMFLVATLVFIYGIYKMISNAGESSAREEGTRNIMYGVLGMFIMVSVYGIIRLIANTLGLTDPFL